MTPTVLKQRAELFLPAEKYGVTSVASIPQTFTHEKVFEPPKWNFGTGN